MNDLYGMIRIMAARRSISNQKVTLYFHFSINEVSTLGFARTIALRLSTLIAMIVDIINSLLKHGFNSFYFLNGHGGNIPTIKAAFAFDYRERFPDGRIISNSNLANIDAGKLLFQAATELAKDYQLFLKNWI